MRCCGRSVGACLAIALTVGCDSESQDGDCWLGTSAPEYKAVVNQGVPMKVRCARL